LGNQGGETLSGSAIAKPPAAQENASGYLHFLYAQSLEQFGTPRFLSQSAGWILERAIPGSAYADAMGCYPLFACGDWSQLHRDIENIGNNFVSLSVVTDPFGEYDLNYLRQCFPDVAIPFKEHFVVDLSRPSETFVRPHHLRNARKARAVVQVERCERADDFLNDWINLYATLVKKHGISGIAAFSPECFAKQFAVPGLVALRAVHEETTVGMLLWYVQGDIAYYHLGAYSERGYDLRASFALFSYALELFAERGLRWLNLGGAAGAGNEQKTGLGRFKEGWSTGTRTAYFCGRVFDRQKYDEIMRTKRSPETNYFPAYRAGEFG
jgi:hypothetical protein